MKFTNKHNLPFEIEIALSRDWYDNPEAISVTRLIDSPRIYYLLQRHKDIIEMDVSERIWTLFGSAIHAVLANTAMENRLKEERLTIEVEGIKLTGKFDVYGGDGLITDYKVTSVWSIIFDSRKKEWKRQINCYAYLLRQYGFKPNGAQIIAILRDWQKSKAEKESDYPPIPIAVIPIELWKPEQVEEYIKQRIELFKACQDLPDELLPPCSDEEKWMSETKYAVMRNGRKTAIKLFNNKEEAEAYAGNIKGGYVEKRLGESKRCKEYCPVRQVCNLNPYKEE